MSGSVAALIELMSVGKQNKVLNHDPQITFWRFTHMRYTDFSLEQVRVTPNNGSNGLVSTGGTINFDLPRSGDLCNNAFLVYHLPGLVNITTSTEKLPKPWPHQKLPILKRVNRCWKNNSCSVYRICRRGRTTSPGSILGLRPQRKGSLPTAQPQAKGSRLSRPI